MSHLAQGTHSLGLELFVGWEPCRKTTQMATPRKENAQEALVVGPE